MADLFVVRHAHSLRPPGPEYDGLSPISDLGRQQIDWVVHRLKTEFGQGSPDVIDCATSPRSRQMAKLLGGLAGWSTEIRPWEALNHTRRLPDGSSVLLSAPEVWRGQSRWGGKELGINTSAVVVASRRWIELLTTDLPALEVDPAQLSEGALLSVRLGRRGRVEYAHFLGAPTPLELISAEQ